MSTIPAYPLQWPTGWKRTGAAQRGAAQFRKGRRQRYDGNWESARDLTIAEGVDRVRAELQRMANTDDIVISTNLELRLDGLPKSGQRNPDDPGAAVYWRDRIGETRCMAIDRYDRVADNLAAIAATLDAMRAIERHGGAAILDRAFTGFTALPAPEAAKPWHVALGCPAHCATDTVRTLYRAARSKHHPDRGGDADTFNDITRAWEAFCAERGITE